MQRGDIICWRVFSLPSSRLVTELLLAEHSGLKKELFPLVKRSWTMNTYTFLKTHTELKLKNNSIRVRELM